MCSYILIQPHLPFAVWILPAFITQRLPKTLPCNTVMLNNTPHFSQWKKPFSNGYMKASEHPLAAGWAQVSGTSSCNRSFYLVSWQFRRMSWRPAVPGLPRHGSTGALPSRARRVQGPLPSPAERAGLRAERRSGTKGKAAREAPDSPCSGTKHLLARTAPAQR